MKKRVNIAVIGTGRMGSVHTRNLARAIPEANLVALCDIRLEVAQALADELGVPRVVRDYHDLLTDPSIEAILIATPTDTHTFIVEDVAAAGKHIFCEKPIALNLADVDRTLAAVERAGVKFQVGFNRRFDKNFQRVHDIVASGEIGRPCILHIISRDPEPPSLEYARASGGMFLDMTIHDFDMARYQLGEVEEVYATGKILVAPQLEQANDVDTTLTMLKFANGAIGMIDNSRRAAYGYDQRLEILGSHGSISVENESENKLVRADKDGYHTSRLLYFFMNRYAPCYVEEVRQFVECVRDDKPVPVGGADGRAAVVLGYAAWKSFRENRPVKVSEIK